MQKKRAIKLNSYVCGVVIPQSGIEIDDMVMICKVLQLRRLRQLSTVVVSKVQSQMSLEECKSWTCIVLLDLRAKVQVERLSIKD